jgi:hypothetical protein
MIFMGGDSTGGWALDNRSEKGGYGTMGNPDGPFKHRYPSDESIKEI